MTSTKTTTLTVVVGVGLLTGCGGGVAIPADSGPSSATSMATSSVPATASAPTASATNQAGPRPGGKGCAPTGNGIPAGGHSGPTVDVDGDGRADSAWLQDTGSGVFTLGITTASGATFSTPFSSPSPLPRRALVADVDGHGTVAAIVSEGRSAGLFVVVGCSLVPAKTPQGEPYVFDLSYGNTGTGVGCAPDTAGSGRGLVGLKLNRDSAQNPTTVTRTAVRIDGTSAVNGASVTVDVSGDPTGPVATAAKDITCGELTMKANGVG